MTDAPDNFRYGLTGRVLLLYALIAFIPMSVLFLNPLDLPLFYPRADMATSLWNMWWFDQSFWKGDNPYVCPVLFHPYGTYLYLHTFEIIESLVTTPLRLLGGVSLAWKGATLLHTFWTCVAVHLLARRLGVVPKGAVLAAAIIATCTYRTVNVPALSLGTTGHTFFLAWAAVRCWQEPGRLRHGAWLGFAAVVLLFSHLYYLLFVSFFLAAAGLWLAIRTHPGRAAWSGWARQLLIAAAIGAAPLAFMANGIRIAQQHLGATPGYELWNQVRGSADLMQFAAPVWLRALLTGQEAPRHAYLLYVLPLRVTSYCPPLFLVALAAFGWRLARKRGTENATPHLAAHVRAALLVVAVAALFLALGPRVKVWTTLDPADVPFEEVHARVPHWEGISFPSPYALVAQWPVLRHIRGNMRSGFFFFAAAVLLLANPAARACDRLADAMRRHNLRAWIIWPAIAGILWFEHSVPIFYSHPHHDVSGIEAIAADPAPGGVRVYPATGFVVQGVAMYQQTIHGRPILGGYLSRDLPGYDDWLRTRLWEEFCNAMIGGTFPILTPGENAEFRRQCADDGLRFLILYPAFFLTEERYERFILNLESQRLARLRWRSDVFAVMEISGPDEPAR